MIIRTPRQSPIVVGLLLGLAVTVGCAAGETSTSAVESLVPPTNPGDRAVTVETTGCGYASGRVGSGVAIGGGLVVTVAHLVVHASSATVSVGGAPASHEATVAAVDLQRDLAVLRVPADGLPGVTTATAVKGDRGSVVGAATSGTVPFQIRGVVELTIEDVVGNGRHSRLGYQLDAATADGDSGAGVYDAQDRLIGVVFATSDEGTTTWATATAEIEDLLETTGPDDVYDLCS